MKLIYHSLFKLFTNDMDSKRSQSSSSPSSSFIPSLISASKYRHIPISHPNVSTLPAPSPQEPEPEKPILLTKEETEKLLRKLKCNQEYQKVLQQNLKNLDAALAKIHALQKEYKKESVNPRGKGPTINLMELPTKKHESKSQSKSGGGALSDDEEEEINGDNELQMVSNVMVRRSNLNPFFLDPDGRIPPTPTLTSQSTQGSSNTYFSMSAVIDPANKKKRLTDPDHELLRKLVRQQNQQNRFNRLYQKYSSISKTEDIAQFEEDKAALEKLSPQDLERDSSQIDWKKIQAAGFPNRTPDELAIEWKTFCDPNFERGAWTAQEDEQLKAAVEKHKVPNWNLISAELGNKRLPIYYVSRYIRHHLTKTSSSPDARQLTRREYVTSPATQMRRKSRSNTAAAKALSAVDEIAETSTKSGLKWTPEEDERLTQAVKQLGDKNWQAVANLIGGRTGQQCLHRWQKTLDPSIKKGKWTREEDLQLTLSVAAYGAKNWVLVRKHVPGRTDVQCRERWVNVLDPTVRGNENWTAAEDRVLMQIVPSLEGKWAQVAKLLADTMMSQESEASKSSSSSISTMVSSSTLPPRSALANAEQTSNSTGLDSQGISATIGQTSTEPSKQLQTTYRPKTDNQCWRRWKVLTKRQAGQSRAQRGYHSSKPASKKRRSPYSVSLDKWSDDEDDDIYQMKPSNTAASREDRAARRRARKDATTPANRSFVAPLEPFQMEASNDEYHDEDDDLELGPPRKKPKTC